MSKKLYAVLIFVCMFAAFILGLFSYKFLKIMRKNDTNQNVSAPSLVLDTLPVHSENVTVSQKYIGYVKPIHEANLQPYISGYIEKIYVKGGEIVREGDVLVVLKQDEYKAALNAAYADILKAQADYKNKASYLKRIQKAAHAVSQSDLDNAEASYLSAAAALEQAKANYDSAKVNYDYTFIRAPISGVVGDVFLTKGNYVSPSVPALLNIVQYNPIRVVFSISDKEYLDELKKEKPFFDEKIDLELPNGEIFSNAGVFQYMGNTLNKATNSIAVYADFKNIGKILTPDTYVTVFVKKTIKDAVSLSKDKVLLESDGSFVYVIRNGILHKVKAEILASVDNDFILKNTFENNDEIVIDQVLPSYLGMPVKKKKGA